MTISNVILGENIDPDWGNAVADAINNTVSVVERGIYTPSLTNVNIGTGGSAQNTAKYTYVGGTAVGSYGAITISTHLVLGTSGFSVTGGPTLTLPPGFEFDPVVSTATLRLGFVTLVSSLFGVVQWASANTFAYSALNAASTYLAPATLSATVPATWAAGHVMRANFTAAVVRV